MKFFRMRKKQFEYGMYGLLIGAIIGFFAGILMSNQFKKSQRDFALPIAVSLGTLFCSVAGYWIGGQLGASIYVEERLGIDKVLDDGFFKDGRFWVGSTRWKDRRNGREYTLQTAKNHQKVLVSSLNGRPIIKHDCTSASQQTVPRYHNLAKGFVFKLLKNNF